MKVVDLNREKYLRALIYGDSGVGKTTLLGSFQECAETSPVLILNSRGQPISLAELDPPPLVLEIETVTDFNAPYDWLLKGQGDGPGEFIEVCQQYLSHHGFGRFRTVAIDSITHVQRVALNQITKQLSLRPGDVPKGVQIAQWGEALRLMTNLTDLYFKLPCNVIMTALCKWTTLQWTGETTYAPLLSGQSSQEVPSHAELVGRLIQLDSLPTQKVNMLTKAMPDEIAGAFNILATVGARNYVAKWQGVNDPPSLVPAPTAEKLMSILNR